MPIRLKVAYKTDQSLVTEYTKSLSRGGCSIETKHPLPVGTRFVFEMYTAGDPKPVEVEGKVIYTLSVDGQNHTLGIEYVAASDERRAGLQRVLDRIFAAQQWETTRRFPRIPINVTGHDDRSPPNPYVIRDVSLGGMGLKVVGRAVPPDGVVTGTRVVVELKFDGQAALALNGEVVWTTGAVDIPADAGVGIAFQQLAAEVQQRLAGLLHLQQIPVSATFHFGR